MYTFMFSVVFFASISNAFSELSPVRNVTCNWEQLPEHSSYALLEAGRTSMGLPGPVRATLTLDRRATTTQTNTSSCQITVYSLWCAESQSSILWISNDWVLIFEVDRLFFCSDFNAKWNYTLIRSDDYPLLLAIQAALYYDHNNEYYEWIWILIETPIDEVADARTSLLASQRENAAKLTERYTSIRADELRSVSDALLDVIEGATDSRWWWIIGVLGASFLLVALCAFLCEML